MNDLISVIVPVYNVEKYLRRCVDSILAQTYQNTEVILVDDGSTDSSGLICDEFASKDERVKVIHKENGGLSDARNAGISVATGVYIAFCDSDDWMESAILKKAESVAINEDADIVIWGYSADFVDDKEHLLSHVEHVPNAILCQIGQENSILSSDLMLGLIGYAWNKLYKTELIRNLLFEKSVSLVEDILFNKEAFVKADKIAFIEKIGTHYIQRSRETLGTKFYTDFFDLKYRACQARESILMHFGFSGEHLQNVMAPVYFGVLEAVVRVASRAKQLSSNDERAQYLRTVFKTDKAQSILKEYRPHLNKRGILYLLMLLKVYPIMIHMFQIKAR